MTIIPLNPKTLVSHIDDMYKSLNANPQRPEVYIDLNNGAPVIVITGPVLIITSQDEDDAIQELL